MRESVKKPDRKSAPSIETLEPKTAPGLIWGGE